MLCYNATNIHFTMLYVIINMDKLLCKKMFYKEKLTLYQLHVKSQTQRAKLDFLITRLVLCLMSGQVREKRERLLKRKVFFFNFF